MVMQPKKFGRYIVLGIFVLFLFNSPAQAAELVNWGVDVLEQGADAMGVFANNVDK